MTYPTYLQSPHWQHLRAHLLLTRGARCERCQALGAVDAHHLSYAHLGCERPEEIILLCRACHRDMHSLATVEAGDAAYERAARLFGPEDERSTP